MARFMTELYRLMILDKESATSDMLQVLRDAGVIRKVSSLQPIKSNKLQTLGDHIRVKSKENAGYLLVKLLIQDKFLTFTESPNQDPDATDFYASVEVVKESHERQQ